MQNKPIKLSDLIQHCSLSPAKCAALAEAASVCLESQNHRSGVMLKVSGSYSSVLQVQWDQLEAKAKDSWNNLEEAIEDGAYGIAIATIWVLTDYKVIKQSFKGSGFDYWLGEKHKGHPFQEKARLEVSGILKGNNGQINQRLKEKLKQTKKSDNLKLSVFVVIVECSAPQIKIKKR